MVKTILVVLALSIPVAAQQTTFKREILFQRVENGRVIQEHVRRSQFTYNDRGKLVETILYKSPSLKDISDDTVENFGAGQGKPLPGIQMIGRDYAFREFKSEVIVKDAWNAHWPAGSRVKVYFSADFNADLPVLMQVLNTWNALVPEVRFAYAGVAEEAQICESCLTVLRNPALGNNGRFQEASRDGLIVYARIYLGRMDHKTLFSIFAHELGHGLGLDHSSTPLMKERVEKGKRIYPSQVDVDLVRRLLR